MLCPSTAHTSLPLLSLCMAPSHPLVQAKRKYEAVLQQKQAVEADNRELGEKYSQKAKWVNHYQ